MAEHRTVDRPIGSKRITQPQRGPLRLRVIGTARNGQVIEISATRLTIGSGPQCTLRLRAAGVRPLQCLIVREPSGPVVRSLSVETLLNGQKFREELLQPGDRLRIGSIELELCDSDCPPAVVPQRPLRTGTTPQVVDPNAFSPKTETEPLHSVESLARLEQLEQQFDEFRITEQATATATPADLVDEPMKVSSTVSRIVPAEDASDHLLDLQRLAAERQHFQVELALTNERYEAVRTQLARLENEQNTLRARYDEQQSDVIRLRAALEQALVTERDLRCELDRKLAELSARVAELQAQCLSLQAYTERERCDQAAAPTTPIVAVEQEQQPLQRTSGSDISPAPPTAPSSSAHRRQEMDWLAQQFANAGTESGDESRDIELPPLAVTPSCASVAQVVTEETSTDTANETSKAESIFARLARAGIWNDPDHQSEIKPESNPEPELLSPPNGDVKEVAESDAVLAPPEPTWNPAATDSLSSDDSIEAYMERLLQRVRGDSGMPATTLQTYSPVSERLPRTEADLKLVEPMSPVVPGPLTESEYQPRRQAPEMSAGLAAMRAIGNDNRRKHIQTHAQRKCAANSQVKLLGSVIGLAVATSSFFYLDTHTELAALGLCAGCGVAGFWIVQAIQARKQLFDALRLNTEQLPGKQPSDSN